MSYEDAERCGLGHLHPDRPGNRAGAPAAAAPRVAPGSGRRPRISGLNGKGQNKAEAAFDDALAGSPGVRGYEFEPFKLRLAAKTWLRIDFVVMPVCPVLNAQPLELIDVKGGPWEDDAAVKMKVAADKFRWLGRFWVVRRTSHRQPWEWWPVTARGGLGKPCDAPAWFR